MGKPLFSVIIPTYNGSQRIGYCLRSIFKQKYPQDNFEVIVVDDCSTEDISASVMKVLSEFPDEGFNVKVIRLPQNGRQGKARNVGFAKAIGKYLINIDDDDALNGDDIFEKIEKVLKDSSVDVLLLDSYNVVNGKCNNELKFKDNDAKVYNGKEFMEKQSVSWTAWHYVISKEFLEKSNIKFCENVLYEDVDFCLDIVSHASTISYRPIPIILYTIREGQTSKIGLTERRVDDLFKLTERLNMLAQSFADSRKENIRNHYIFQMNVIVSRNLWRLKRDEIVRLLNSHRPDNLEFSKLTNFAFKNPKVYSIVAQISRPVLLSMIRIMKRLRK